MTKSKAKKRAAAERRLVLYTNDQQNRSPAKTNRNVQGAPTQRGLFRPVRDAMRDNTTVGQLDLTFRGSGGRKYGGKASRVRGPDGRTLPHLVASYIDPFDEASRCVKYPDPYLGLSETATLTTVMSIVTAPSASGSFGDANMSSVTPNSGTSLFLVTPDPSNLIVQGVCGDPPATSFMSGESNVFNWPNGIVFSGAKDSLNAFGPGTGTVGIDNTAGNLAGVRSMFSAARLVSGGIKLTSTLNFSTVSGTLHIAPVFVNLSRMTNFGTVIPNSPVNSEMQNGWQLTLPWNLQMMSNLPGYKQYPLSALETDEVHAIFARAGEEALLFKPLATAWGMDDGNAGDLTKRVGDANLPDSYGHYCILVFVDGVTTSGNPLSAAAGLTPIMELEVRQHLECQINPLPALAMGANVLTNVTSSDARQAAPSQPAFMAAMDNLCAAVPSVRCIDESGVAEEGFVAEVARMWGVAKRVATTIGGVVEVIGPMLGAMVV